MSAKNDPAQGVVADPKALGRKLSTSTPNSAAQVKREAQPALDAQAQKFAEPKGRGQRQNWRTG